MFFCLSSTLLNSQEFECKNRQFFLYFVVTFLLCNIINFCFCFTLGIKSLKLCINLAIKFFPKMTLTQKNIFCNFYCVGILKNNLINRHSINTGVLFYFQRFRIPHGWYGCYLSCRNRKNKGNSSFLFFPDRNNFTFLYEKCIIEDCRHGIMSNANTVKNIREQLLWF